MTIVPKLTTVAACRVARLDRDRFNEHVAAGRFGCAPSTVPGRARLFDPDDMIALCLFSDLLEDGIAVNQAGHIACEVARAAREHPEAQAISYVRSTTVQSGFSADSAAIPAGSVPEPSTWNKTLFHGGLIEKVTTFNVWQMRQRIAHRTEEERSIIGEVD
ncbi:hypothetical protein EJV44_11325 [Ancylobacter aquaticus]|nr:hypothetical protein EJV44_11325 [Ancylobacter aquaticus]